MNGSLQYEKKLHTMLQKDYIKDVRPEQEHDAPVTVEFSLVLQGISKLVCNFMSSDTLIVFLHLLKQ